MLSKGCTVPPRPRGSAVQRRDVRHAWLHAPRREKPGARAVMRLAQRSPPPRSPPPSQPPPSRRRRRHL
eukprot:scaffold31025_cov61-Phaeocystis_antarctica.AAC.1